MIRPLGHDAMTKRTRIPDVIFLWGFEAAPMWMWATLALTVIAGLATSVYPFGFKLLVDGVVSSSSRGVLIGTAVSAGLLAVYWLTATLEANVGFGLIDRVDFFVSGRIADLLSVSGHIDQFEDPTRLAEVDLIRQRKFAIASAPRHTLTVLSVVVRAFATAALLVTVHPILCALPLLGLAPAAAHRKAVAIRERADGEVVEARRLADRIFNLATDPAAAKELRVSRLAEDLERRHRALRRAIGTAALRAETTSAAIDSLGWLLFVGGFVGALALVVQRALNGAASPGQVVLAVVLAQQIRLLFGQGAPALGEVLGNIRTAERLIALERSLTPVVERPNAPVPVRVRHGIVLDRVSFRYPGATSDVLRDISLSLPAGSSVALVGENGAGKSTFIKLLAGLYTPSTGRILVDDIDLARYAGKEWRERMTAAFQDPVAFELILSEAVGVGDLPHLDDRTEIDRSLAEAQAGDVVDSVGGDLAAQLGRSFPEGHQLSGGQWQKLALARSRMRRDPLLLVLDEPTSNLDADAEHEIYTRSIAAARTSRLRHGAITVLVSHRYATTSSADFVAMLVDGRLVEFGPHSELLEAKGRYAELFRLQAKGYQ